jgi:phosphatidylinositol alpha-1,6-mannosyltransferase
MKRLRIVITTSHALPHVGGLEVFVDQEIRALASLGHEVVQITSSEGGSGETPDYPPNVRVVRVASSGFVERRLGLFLPIFSPRLLTILMHEIEHCDAVHSHGWIAPNSAAALLVARLLGKPSILTEHNGIQPRRSRFFTLLARLAVETLGRMSVRLARRCMAINSRIEKSLRRFGGPRKSIGFAPFPVDKNRFHPPSEAERRSAREQLGWCDNRVRVLFVGKLVAEKGVPLLLAAADPQYDLVFCGAGDPAILGPLPRPGVEYLAPRPQPELVRLYHAADLFVLPSAIEGFPLVAREALACGLKAVLAYDPGYEPFRLLPNLSFCGLTPESVRLSIREALARPLEDSASSAFDYSPQEWVRRIYRFDTTVRTNA